MYWLKLIVAVIIAVGVISFVAHSTLVPLVCGALLALIVAALVVKVVVAN